MRLAVLGFVVALLSHPSLAATPKANASGVKAVFGGGGTAPTHPDQGKLWKKTFDLPGGKKAQTVWLSYEDATCARSRIYEDHDPMTLPNGVYTWIVTSEGVTSFGHPIDAWEIGTRHAHLAHGRTVVAAGEARKSNTELKLSILSGTFSIQMVNKGLVSADALEKRTVTWFDEVLRAKYGWPGKQKVTLNKYPKLVDPYDASTWTRGREKIFELKLTEPDKAGFKALCGCSAFAKNNGSVCK